MSATNNCLAATLLWVCSLLSQPAGAQTVPDSLQTARIDAIVRATMDSLSSSRFVTADTTEGNRRIAGVYVNGQLVSITYYDLPEICSVITAFYLHHDSLVLALHRMYLPDKRSTPPPAKTYTYYYANDQLVNTGIHIPQTPVPCFTLADVGWGTQYPAECTHYKKLVTARWQTLYGKKAPANKTIKAKP